MSVSDTQPIKQKIIYVYRHLGYPKHDGWLKIGDETGLDSRRIINQNEADNMPTETLFQIPAIDVYGHSFRDYDIHRGLELAGYEREPKAANAKRKSEWFKVDLATVQQIIDDRIHCRGSFLNRRPTGAEKPQIVLRAEQVKAINVTYGYWENRAQFPDRNFLWNAKPRFGKTLTAYKFAEKIGAKRILIVTNRPAISDSWARDFYDHIEQDSQINYLFAASKSFFVNHRRVPSREDILNVSGEFANNLSRPLIFFISLQDLKGRSADATGFKQKNQWIFDLPGGWDLLIIDESHEGVRTLRTADVRKNLKVDFTLHLSGTPFKAIADGEFTSDQIFNWSYSDEQEAKEIWDYEQGDNPYAVLPRMNFRAYHMSTMMESQVEDQEACFDLGEFFKASGNGFVRPGDVEKWLDKISGVKRDSATGAVTILPVDGKLNQPFDSEEKRNQLRHTFWFMSRINECRAMKELLNKHPIFKDYKVILAAGKGDDEYEGKKVLEQVQNAIGKDPTTTKTITLSCGQLTTGITVRPWTAVFMLYGTTGTGSIIKSSSTQYLQAAFRAQNPWSYGEHQEFYKSDCYVFDFAPDRVLTILQDYAVNLSGSKKHEDHKPAIRKLLNYMSVISMDDAGELRELDAKGIVELPRKLIAKEIVDGGFVTSNKLFNISNIFHASPEARAIINKLQAVKKQKLEKNPQDLPEPQTKVDEDDNVIIDPEILVNTSNGILKEKKYEELTTAEAQMAREAAQNERTLDSSYLPDEIPAAKQALIQEAAQEIKVAAQKKTEERKKKEEDEYRDKLRGFARTIPMLLHAYGRYGITFDDLEKIIADDVFEQITGISKDEFRVLRKENYFNEDNCNVAIKEFMSREEELSNYFSIGVDADIFDYIPMQEQNRVFTPKKVVAKMLDMLEEENPEIFQSTRRKFLDPYSKSGLFLAGIVKRLYQNLRPRFRSEKDCLMHILSNQIYAWSPSDPLRKSSINTVIGFMRFNRNDYEPKDKRSLENNFLNYNPMNEKGEINYEQVLEHIQKCWGEDMKFDVIIGNPPYQLGRRQIYADFYRMAVDLKPDLLCMVFPVGWQKPTNTNGLSQLNNEKYKRDRHLIRIDNYYEDGPDRLFPNVGTGGVNIVLRDSHKDNGGDIEKFEYGQMVGRVVLPISQEESDKPDELKSLLARVDYSNNMEQLGSSSKPYNFRADPLRAPQVYGITLENDRQRQDDVRLFGLLPRGGRGYKYTSRATIPRISPNIDTYKLFVPKAWGNMSKNAGLGGSYSNIGIARPGDICSETFIEFGPFKSDEEARKMAKYFFTKFFRALLFLAKDSQNTAKEKYKFIPLPDLSKPYFNKSIAEIDEALFEEYNIPQEIREFIRKNIQTRDESNIDIL